MARFRWEVSGVGWQYTLMISKLLGKMLLPAQIFGDFKINGSVHLRSGWRRSTPWSFVDLRFLRPSGSSSLPERLPEGPFGKVSWLEMSLTLIFRRCEGLRRWWGNSFGLQFAREWTSPMRSPGWEGMWLAAQFGFKNVGHRFCFFYGLLYPHHLNGEPCRERRHSHALWCFVWSTRVSRVSGVDGYVLWSFDPVGKQATAIWNFVEFRGGAHGVYGRADGWILRDHCSHPGEWGWE